MAQKKTESLNVWLLRGEDDYTKQQFLNKLLEELVNESMKDFDFEVLDGTNTKADRVISALSVCPFISDKRVVLLKYPNKLEENDQKTIADFLSTIPKSSVLIMYNMAPEKIDGQIKKSSDVIGELLHAARKAGTVKDFGLLKRNDALELIKNILSEYNLKANPALVALLQQRLGLDSSIIASELLKLRNYCGDKNTIDVNDISAVISETHEEKIFKIVDAITAKNLKEALILICEHFEASEDQNAEAPKTLAVIARQFRLLFQAKILTEYGIKSINRDNISDDIFEMLPQEQNIIDIVSKQRWLESKLLAASKKMSYKSFVAGFMAISEADNALKGIDGTDEPLATMKNLIIKLCR